MKTIQEQMTIANDEIVRLGFQDEVWAINGSKYSVQLYVDFYYSTIIKLQNEAYRLINHDDSSKIATYRNNDTNIDFVVCQK